MNDFERVVIIKVNRDIKKIINILDTAHESFSKKKPQYYNSVGVDKKENLLILKENKKSLVVIVDYEDVNEVKVKSKFHINKLYMGEIQEITETGSIKYQIKAEITSELVIKNFIYNCELDLEKDFKKRSYILFAYSNVLINELDSIIRGPHCPEYNNFQKYVDSYNQQNLHKYAQHNKNCIRMYGTLAEDPNRNEFQRDRERIVNSKAFRRLVDKAQIFTSSKGDHYRTRMTHTLEVAQIARSIASELQLNMDLTEAIALAHDLGHTPFGHQGERTLDNILKGKNEVIKLPENKVSRNLFGGFKHNFQGLRVLTKLEEKYIGFSGLDISYQVLEGVLKHTNFQPKECQKCENDNNCMQKCFSLREFFPEKFVDCLYHQLPFSSTLEGQVVAVADEIAQRGHDIDDAFSSGLLTTGELIDYLKLQKMEELKSIVEKSEKAISAGLRVYIDKEELKCARIVSDIVAYFIRDVIIESKDQMKHYSPNDEYINNHRFTEELIRFSDIGIILNSYLEKIIKRKALNSLEVSKFDNNSAAITLALFKAYYYNPQLLHKGTLKRIFIDIQNHCNEEVSNNIIDLVNGDTDLVREELVTIATKKIPTEEEWSMQDNEYLEKRIILVRNIVDYIAGMTDSYAINEYNSIIHKI